MSDPLWFGVVFVGFFVLRAIVATWVFLFLLPDGDHCPNCGEITLRVEARPWNRLLPWFRTSWCYSCNWEGLLRRRSARKSRDTPAYSDRSS